ncbi:RNA-directed DNA polymerase, eukaryota, partial [Tanacetum coccineum]
MPKADSISKKKGWDTVVKRFDVRLSKWKASFSIGGRSTLLTSVLGALVVMGGFSEFRRVARGNGVWARILKYIHVIKIFVLGFQDCSVLRRIKTVLFGIVGMMLIDGKDEWIWTLDSSNTFVVKITRQHIDSLLLPELPIRLNLSNKGIEIESLLCPVCSSSSETVDHILWTCSFATFIWLKSFQWLDLVFPLSLSIPEALEDLDHRHFSKENKEIVAVILGVVFWSLWKFRNESIFSRHP